jgi:hypothetical protein
LRILARLTALFALLTLLRDEALEGSRIVESFLTG